MDKRLRLTIAKHATGIEASGDQPLPEHITRGLGRTSIIDRDPSGLPITREGVLVAVQMEANQRTAAVNRRILELEQETAALEAVIAFDTAVTKLHPDSPDYVQAQDRMQNLLRELGPERADAVLNLAKQKKEQDTTEGF